MTHGTHDLVAAAKDAGVERFVLMSALGTSEPPKDTVPYYAAKWAMEREVKALRARVHDLPPELHLRPDGGALPTFMKQVKLSPVVTVIGSGMQRIQPIWSRTSPSTSRARRRSDAPPNRTFELGGPDIVDLERALPRDRRRARQAPDAPACPDRSCADRRQADASGLPGAPLTPDQVTMIEARDNVASNTDAVDTFSAPARPARRAAPARRLSAGQSLAEGSEHRRAATVSSIAGGTGCGPGRNRSGSRGELSQANAPAARSRDPSTWIGLPAAAVRLNISPRPSSRTPAVLGDVVGEPCPAERRQSISREVARRSRAARRPASARARLHRSRPSAPVTVITTSASRSALVQSRTRMPSNAASSALTGSRSTTSTTRRRLGAPARRRVRTRRSRSRRTSSPRRAGSWSRMNAFDDSRADAVGVLDQPLQRASRRSRRPGRGRAPRAPPSSRFAPEVVSSVAGGDGARHARPSRRSDRRRCRAADRGPRRRIRSTCAACAA